MESARELHRIGEWDAAVETFLREVAANLPAELIDHADSEAYCGARAGKEGDLVLVGAGSGFEESLQHLRAEGPRCYFVVVGSQLSREVLSTAVNCRAIGVLDIRDIGIKDAAEILRKAFETSSTDRDADQLLTSLKSLLLSRNEGDSPEELVGELKTALGKMERKLRGNLFAPRREQVDHETKLPFHKSADLREALLTIGDLERTGELSIKSEFGGDGEICFLQGKLASADAGPVRGHKALMRMFLWEQPEFEFKHLDPSEIPVDEDLHEDLATVVEHGMSLNKEFQSFRKEVPPGSLKLELDPNALKQGCELSPDQFATIASVVELGKVVHILDYNPLEDVTLLRSLISLRKEKLIRVAR